MQSKAIKIGTIVLFVLLLLGFVGYKSGWFSTSKISAPAPKLESVTEQSDSVEEKKEIQVHDFYIDHAHSSKSAPVIEWDDIPIDTVPEPELKLDLDDPEIMRAFSSKSAEIFDADDILFEPQNENAPPQFDSDSMFKRKK